MGFFSQKDSPLLLEEINRILKEYFLSEQDRYRKTAKKTQRYWKRGMKTLKGNKKSALADAKDIFKRTESGITQRAISRGLMNTTAPDQAFRDNAGAYARARGDIKADFAGMIADAKFNRPLTPRQGNIYNTLAQLADQGYFTGGRRTHENTDWGRVLAVAGLAAGGIFGGPMGAMMGAQIGGQIGNSGGGGMGGGMGGGFMNLFGGGQRGMWGGGQGPFPLRGQGGGWGGGWGW